MQVTHTGWKFGLPLTLGVLIGIFAVIFALQNTFVATVNILSWHVTLPVALLLAGALGLGALATIVAMIPDAIKDERYMRQLQAQKKEVEDELAKYRIVIPLAPPEQNSQQIPVYVRPMTQQQG